MPMAADLPLQTDHAAEKHRERPSATNSLWKRKFHGARQVSDAMSGAAAAVRP
jgi:hypothetical protein